jgi:hypothetical protein
MIISIDDAHIETRGLPYGEVKNKICWPSKSSYQLPNRVKMLTMMCWEQRVKTDCPSLLLVSCTLSCSSNLSLFPVLGLFLDCANLGSKSSIYPQGASRVYIFIYEIRYFVICQSKINQKSGNVSFPKVSSLLT